MTVTPQPSAEFTAFIREEIARWTSIVRTASLKAE
jgi:tripartite-type tricarboxylate transporter receptor subunit TctC